MYILQSHRTEWENRDFTTKAIVISTDVDTLKRFSSDMNESIGLDPIKQWSELQAGWYESEHFGESVDLWYTIWSIEQI